MVVVPYVKGLTEKTRRIFQRHDIHCAMKPMNSLRSLLVRPKDKRPLLNTSDCVYRIPCGGCKASYVGETSRHLNDRLKEHQASVKKACKSRHTRSRAAAAATETHSSALADHAAQENHVVDWDNTEVLASGCSNKKGRWVREAIHVREQQQPTLNRNDGMYQLNHVWDSLLNNAVIATTRQS